jgi:translation initiation factor IF-2
MSSSTIQRPPVVAIMGHVDHGKSSLLDYIRNSNIVAGEAGGITQHISSYEVSVPDGDGVMQKITFIDTPGHAAFSHMRERGASIADIAILIVSCEEGVKAQTKEAIKTIRSNNVPFIVALTKIDRPHGPIEKIKMELAEQEVFVEGFGGSVPCVTISSKTGENVADLLETILLLAEMEEFTGNPTKKAEGFVVEANMDQKRGISAMVIIKDGTLDQGDFVVVDDAWTTTRIIEDFQGNSLTGATFSSPVRLTGFSELPKIGSLFTAHATKKEAEEQIHLFTTTKKQDTTKRIIPENTDDIAIIPVIIKSDVYGIAEAIEDELLSIEIPDVYIKVIKKGVGNINESDIQLAASDKKSIVIGFNVDVDRKAKDLNETEHVTIETFSIIYKLTEWVYTLALERKPLKEVEKTLAQIKVLKYFSSQKNIHVIGGKVQTGMIKKNGLVKIMRGSDIVGHGKIIGLQLAKSQVDKVEEGNEFGMQLESPGAPESGDLLEAYEKVIE